MQKLNKDTAKVVKKAIKIAKRYGIDPSTIDFPALIDNTLTPDENMRIILEKMVMLIRDEEKRLEFQKKYLNLDVNAEIQKNYEKIREEERKKSEEDALKLLQKSSFRWQQRARNILLSLITAKDRPVKAVMIIGEGGTGKTEFLLAIKKELEDMGYDFYLMTDTHISNKAKFKILTSHKYIIIDDVDNIFSDPEAITLFKKITDPNTKGEVTWSYTQKGELIVESGTPPEFIIIASNGHFKNIDDLAEFYDRLEIIEAKISLAEKKMMLFKELGEGVGKLLLNSFIDDDALKVMSVRDIKRFCWYFKVGFFGGNWEMAERAMAYISKFSKMAKVLHKLMEEHNSIRKIGSILKREYGISEWKWKRIRKMLFNHFIENGKPLNENPFDDTYIPKEDDVRRIVRQMGEMLETEGLVQKSEVRQEKRAVGGENREGFKSGLGGV